MNAIRSLFARRSREPGWLAVALQPGGLSFAHGLSKAGEKSAITRCGSRVFDETTKDLERMVKELGLDRYQCLTLLSPSDYHVLLVDAPNVPPAELRTAVRWKIKDMLDYHVEDATIDVLDIPVDLSQGTRGHSMYAVSARNDVVRGCIERFTNAHIPLSVIDIAETAQRNIAALYEPPERGVGLLYLDKAHALLTINFRGELYLARRIDVSVEQLLHPPGGNADELMNRVLLELQRSFDHLDRQFPFVSLAKLLLGPEPRETGLAAYLGANLDIPVEPVRLEHVLALGPEAALEGDAAWRLFHVVGAALRNETKTL
jgi:MSHA biogenesis protein MshI